MATARSPYQALQHRDFRRMWVAQFISLTGSQMQVVAIHWHVYLLTHSPLALGLVGLTRVIPIVAFSLWGGVVADRRDRRWVMFTTQSAMILVALGLCGFTASGHESLWLIYALNALSAAAVAFDGPARQALIPRLVPIEDLPGALSMNLTMFHAGMIAGPALAGVLIAGVGLGSSGAPPSSHQPRAPVSASANAVPLSSTGAPSLRTEPVTPRAVAAAPTSNGTPSTHGTDAPLPSTSATTTGLAWIYGLNALSFLAVLFSLATMRVSGRVGAEGEVHARPLAALRAGLRFVFTTPLIVWTMALDFFATFFSGAMSLVPIFADQILHVGPRGYGVLMAAPALGAILGSLYTSFRPLPRKQGRVFLWAVAAYGLATIVFGFSRSYVLTFIALAATGLADLVSTVIRQTIRQLATPDALRGRMTSVNMIFFMGGPQLGELEAGFVASLFASVAIGATVSVVTGGIATILTAVCIAALSPVVRRYDTRESVEGTLASS